jgi:hypothetical protein
MQTTHYALNTSITRSNLPFAENIKARVLCSDGKVRATARLSQHPDTFFSTGAAIRVRGRYITGYLTVETRDGFSTETPDDPAVVKFFAHSNHPNAGLLNSLI